MDNQELKQVFQDLYTAIQRNDQETEQQLRFKLTSQGWSAEQIEFFLEERSTDYARASRQRERSNRKNAVLVSFIMAIPTVIASISFQKLALQHDYFLVAQLERWFGGIVIGCLSSLAVNDYRLWLEADVRAKGISVTESAKAFSLWSRQRWQSKVHFLIRPQSFRARIEQVPEEDLIALWERLPSAKQLQGFLLLRFARRGWSDFWRAVAFERNLGPSSFFITVAVFCSFIAATESVTAGLSVGVVAYLQAEIIVPVISVSNIYFPTLLSGVDTGQSSNVSAALRVLVVTFFMATVVLLELWFQHLGVPRIKLFDLI